MSKFSDSIQNHSGKLLKFGLTGGLGTFTDLSLFFLFADIFQFPDIPMNVVCFVISATQNCFINHFWTFRKQCHMPFSFSIWMKYLTSSIAGYGVNLGAYVLLTRTWNWPYKVFPQAIGILCGMLLNYSCANFLVFKEDLIEEES